MLHRLSIEEIEALKPDDASLKAARGIAGPGKWENLGQNAHSIWGECKGSGSRPYLVQMDVAAQAFKCTCPSRKFPCKHSLALCLMYVGYNNLYNGTEAPLWVSEWMGGRQARAEKKQEKAVDPASASLKDHQKSVQQTEKRRSQRNKRIQDGLNELQTWLVDQLKHGLGRLPQQLVQIKQMASRMVDAQMPLVARRLNDLHDLVGIDPEWVVRALEKLGQLQLLIEAFSRIENLNPAEQADLFEALGVSNKETPENTGISSLSSEDIWVVLGVTFQAEKKLWRRMVWLQGQGSGRFALLLDFNFGGSSFTPAYIEGQVINGVCQYFLSQYPLRARMESSELTEIPPRLGFSSDSADCLNSYARQLGLQPWTWVSPWAVNNMRICFDEQKQLFFARDDNYIFVLNIGEPDGWRLLAVSGDLPVVLFAEFANRKLTPLSAWREQELIWKNEDMKP